jgi:hypothetical protein
VSATAISSGIERLPTLGLHSRQIRQGTTRTVSILHCSIEGRATRVKQNTNKKWTSLKRFSQLTTNLILEPSTRGESRSVLSYQVSRQNPSPFGSAPRAGSQECE